VGGPGSGKRPFRSIAGGTDEYFAIDVRKLRTKGLRPAASALGQHICLAAIAHGSFADHISSSGSGQLIRLEWTACRFGGSRPWFRCPVESCRRRVAILYGGPYFACRHCHRLAYPSQREAIDDRAVRRAERIRRRLNWPPGVANWKSTKPARMRWQTFERLSAEHEALVEVAFAGLKYRLRALERAI
jgi:hypothetical protein